MDLTNILIWLTYNLLNPLTNTHKAAKDRKNLRKHITYKG